MNEPNPYEPPQTSNVNESHNSSDRFAHRWNQMEPNWTRVSRGAKKCLFAMGTSIACLIFAVGLYFLTDFFTDNSRNSEIVNVILEIVFGLAITTSFILYFISQLSGLRDLLAVGRKNASFAVLFNGLMFFVAHWIVVAVGFACGELSPQRIQEYYENKSMSVNHFMIYQWITNLNYHFMIFFGMMNVAKPLGDYRIRLLAILGLLGMVFQMFVLIHYQYLYNNNRIFGASRSQALIQKNAIFSLVGATVLYIFFNACYVIALKIIAVRAEAHSRSEPPIIAPNI